MQDSITFHEALWFVLTEISTSIGDAVAGDNMLHLTAVMSVQSSFWKLESK